jgi:hypothetical protein
MPDNEAGWKAWREAVEPIVRLRELAETRGLVPGDFWKELYEEFCADLHPDSIGYQRKLEMISSLKALDDIFDVFLVRRVLTYEALEKLIRSKGSILLAIARAAAEGDKP